MTKPGFIPTLPPPDQEDAIDLTDHEVRMAVDTNDSTHLTDLLVRAVSPGEASVGKGDARYAVAKHEVRRRKPHLYLRTTLVCPGEPSKILIHRVDWLQSPPQS
jgi:hypothetical protein